MDEWLKCQQGWVYLEPIFGSEDILQQMPNEGRKFRAVDAAWRRVMTRAALSPELLSIAADDELLKTLLDCNKLLDQVSSLSPSPLSQRPNLEKAGRCKFGGPAEMWGAGGASL